MDEPERTPGRGPLVLIVDDHADIRVICAKALEKAGYRTVTAGSGDDALATLGAGTPDLIVLDLMMPGMDGFTTAHMLRSRPETAHTPIIVLTAASAEREPAAYRVGAQAFCVKPVESRRLVALARRLCPLD
ncbi:MAG TPA: response regulator [Candidatus Binatia bacterium]|nr:response regulator [Candidatus Binatia bacterium]